MFLYNTRTEIDHGTTFIEKDVILFDYSYTGDIVFQVNAILRTPGFGFVIKEDDGTDLQTADNSVLITMSNNGVYRVFLNTGGEQVLAVEHYIDAAINIYDPAGEVYLFKKHNEELSVYKAIRQENGLIQEIKLFSYHMRYDMHDYRIGIYSNQGNTVTFASVKTEAPSNWISNVFNAGGGRIKWIRNGFTIDEAEYDIEVEAEDIQMKAGKYWFSYQTDNPDMEVFIYETYRKHTATKRPRKEIKETMVDEEKNILEADGSFVLPTDHAINIKFKGKWGTVTNIAVKNNKNDDFVETSYGVITRPGSRLRFDLTKIKKIRLKATILSVAENDTSESRAYSLFRRGATNLTMSYPVMLNKEVVFTFATNTNMLQVDGADYHVLPGPSTQLIALENVTAIVSELIITLNDGTEINILLQKTIKWNVVNTIDSPILVFDSLDRALDLSSSHRLVAEIVPKIELFNAMNPITLSSYPAINNTNLKIYGIPGQQLVYKNAQTIKEMAEQFTLISYTPDLAALFKKEVGLPYDIRKKYKYIAVSYNAISDYRYLFTNWEREIYDLKQSVRVYLEHTPLDISHDFIIYGIKNEKYFNWDLLYYIPSIAQENSIDLSAYEYDIIDPTLYSVNVLGKVIFDVEILKQYRYLIIDYLKAESYAINEHENNYEVDIASADTQVSVVYDSYDGTTTQKYRLLSSIQKMIKDDNTPEENDFVILETRE